MKTLFLHIGTPKTGTSSIQSFCAKNRAVLEKKGYCFPRTVQRFPLVGKNRNAHFMIAKITGENGKRDHAEEQRIFSLGMEQIHKCFQEYENVVISEESIWLCCNDTHREPWNTLIADAKEYGYVVKIIVYLRRQDEYLSSRWNQVIKSGHSVVPWEKHFRDAPVKSKYMLDYAANMNNLAEMFGKENIFVRRFSRDSFYKGTIYADFFQCLGLEITDEYQELKEEANLALKGNTVEIKRIINTSPAFNKYDNLYWRQLISMCSAKSDENYKCSMLSKEEAEEFLGLYREGNEQIAADFIGDGKPLFYYDVQDARKWEKNNDYMLDDVIRVFSAITYDSHKDILALQERVNILEKQNKEMKKQMKEERLSMDNIKRKGKRYIGRKLGMKNK